MDDTNTVPMPNGTVTPPQHSFVPQTGTDMDNGFVEYKKAMLSEKSAKSIMGGKAGGFIVNSAVGNKKVERILVFYSDNSFSEYSPT